jgi:hypothetical protein
LSHLWKLNLPINEKQAKEDSESKDYNVYQYVLNGALLWVRAGLKYIRLDHVIGPRKAFWI